MAVFIGTSAAAVSSCSLVDGSGNDACLPQSLYVNETNLVDHNKLETHLVSESENEYHLDEPIEIPAVKLMKFKLGKTSPKEFDI